MPMNSRLALLARLASALLLAAPVFAATFVYVGNAGSSDVWVLRLDEKSGDLTLVEKTSMCITPKVEQT